MILRDIMLQHLKNETDGDSKRYSFPAPGPLKTVFKEIGTYKYNPRPASAKNFSPRPKSGNRYRCSSGGKRRYTFPAPVPRKTVFKHIGKYKYSPRPQTPKNLNPRPKSSNRYECTGVRKDSFKKIFFQIAIPGYY